MSKPAITEVATTSEQELLNPVQGRRMELPGFDTEFVGAKRYLTQLCLIQVVTPAGNYLIDP